jgi:hypothetical protein
VNEIKAKEGRHVRIIYLIISFILNIYKINIVVEPGYIYLRQVVSLDKNFIQSY